MQVCCLGAGGTQMFAGHGLALCRNPTLACYRVMGTSSHAFRCPAAPSLAAPWPLGSTPLKVGKPLSCLPVKTLSPSARPLRVLFPQAMSGSQECAWCWVGGGSAGQGMCLEVEQDLWGNADPNHPKAAEGSGGSGTVDGRQPPVPPAIKLEPPPDLAILAVGSAGRGTARGLLETCAKAL